jgi:hypothetical protein
MGEDGRGLRNERYKKEKRRDQLTFPPGNFFCR